MKKLILVCAFFFLQNLGFSQLISYEKLVSLSQKNFYSIKEFLVQNEYFQTKILNQNGIYTIDFENSDFNEKVSYTYKDLESTKNMISLETRSIQIYKDFINLVKKLGCKNVSAKYQSIRYSSWECQKYEVSIYDGEEIIGLGSNSEKRYPLYSFSVTPK